MRHTYTPVCSLAQQHSYFQQPETASVCLAPTPDTADKLRRAGLLLKATGTGLVVLRALPVPETSETPAPPQPLPDFLFPLRFAVQPLSPYFWNFTALPEPGQLSGGRMIYCFAVGKAAPAGTLTLTMQDARPLPLVPLTLNVAAALAPAPEGNAAKEEVRDLVRGKLLPTTMLRRNATGLSIDLRPWGAGHYQLQRNGKELLPGCYADDQLHATQAWAVLEIERAALAAGPLNIVFAFEARRTRWRYLIRYRATTDPAPTIPERPSIKVRMTPDGKMKMAKEDDSTALVRFAVPKQRPTTGPAADLIFESDEALALTERPGYACTLRYTLHGTPMEIALPAAQSEVLCRPAAPATDPPGPAFSEIVVLL